MTDRKTVVEAKVDASLTYHIPLGVDVQKEVERRLAFVSRHVDDFEIKESYRIEEY